MYKTNIDKHATGLFIPNIQRSKKINPKYPIFSTKVWKIKIKNPEFQNLSLSVV